MKKRVSVFLNNPTSLTYYGSDVKVESDLIQVDLTLEQIRTVLEEGNTVLECLNDYSQEPLTLENYADDRMFEAVLARREREMQLKEQHQEEEKQIYLALQEQRKSLSQEEYKQREKEMYVELERKRNAVRDEIQYMYDHTRGVPFDESEDENIV